jgi:L-seryl-tRNA(Ser) seleniumtransferase
MISWDQKAWRYSTADCAKQLLEGTPAIAVLTDDNPSDVLSRKQTPGKTPRREDKLQIVSMTLRPGEEIIIGQRLRQLLTQARRQGSQS